MHPLIDDFNELTDSELNQKISELSHKYWKTRNPQVQTQMVMILDQLKEEQRLRIHKSQQKNQDSGENDLDNLINIS